MRITLDTDEDLLLAARKIARLEHSTAGAVASRLLRQSLTGMGGGANARSTGSGSAVVAGFVPFAARPGVVVTNDLANQIRDEEGV